MANRRIEVSVGRTVNLGNYESVKANTVISQDIKDDAEVDVIYEELWETAEKQLDDYLAQYEPEDPDKEETIPDQPLEDEIEKAEVEETEVLEETPEVVEEDEELDITEDQINAMTLKELKELCQGTEGMEGIDLSLNIKMLRATIIDLIFVEDEDSGEGELAENPDDAGEPELDGEGGEWADDDWQDGE